MSTNSEKLKGAVKETVGDAIGDDSMAQEGEQQQKKAHKQEEAAELQEKANKKAQEAAGHAGAEKAAQDS